VEELKDADEIILQQTGLFQRIEALNRDKGTIGHGKIHQYKLKNSEWLKLGLESNNYCLLFKFRTCNSRRPT
jgi:hypothetical protein